MSKKIIIIGGGIAGLSAGCYALMSGFDVQILETHSLPGGLCTAWQRKGFTFDGCIHWLVGASPKSSLYRIWEELGVVQGREFYNHEYFAQAVDEQGNEFVAYTDFARLEEHMLRLAPDDEKAIRTFTRDLRRLSKTDIPFQPSLIDLLKMLPILGLFNKYSIPVQVFAKNFKNPILRKLFTAALEWHEMSLIFIMMNLTWMSNGSAAYPIGGSIPIAKSIEERFLNLGGKISYGSKVSKIIVEDNKAVGVRLVDGSEHRGNIIISAADGHSTIFDWLDGKYVDDEIRGYYEKLPVFPPLVLVSLGINADLRKEPTILSFPLKNPITLGEKKLNRMRIVNHSFDPILAPSGKTAVSVMIPTDYDYWVKLGQDKERYQTEKKRIEEAVVNALSERHPNIRSRIEAADVATPLTFVRYTGNWRGSYEGWQFTKETMRVKMKVTLPGLSAFYMAGHWVAPGGGLPGAAISAKEVIKLICKKERVPFKTSTYKVTNSVGNQQHGPDIPSLWQLESS